MAVKAPASPGLPGSKQKTPPKKFFTTAVEPSYQARMMGIDYAEIGDGQIPGSPGVLDALVVEEAARLQQRIVERDYVQTIARDPDAVRYERIYRGLHPDLRYDAEDLHQRRITNLRRAGAHQGVAEIIVGLEDRLTRACEYLDETRRSHQTFMDESKSVIIRQERRIDQLIEENMELRAEIDDLRASIPV